MDFKIAVCDDEAYFRDRIKELLQKYFAEKGLSVSIDLYDSGASFCSDPDNFKAYDVVFLDIEMREMNGMETAYAIREQNENVDIVFITVMLDYAAEGYRVDAVRYIIKDDMEQLLPECLDAILRKRRKNRVEMEFPFVGGKRLVLLEDIIYIESRSHQLWFERKGTQMYMYGQINDLQKQLADFSFIRPHQSFLVNLKYIDRIRNYTIYMTNGMEIPVTKPRYVEVKEKFFDIFLKRKYASLQADVISVALLTGLFLLCAVSTQFGGYYIYRMMAAVASILLFSFIFYSGKWLPRIFLAILFYALYTGASGAVV